MKFLECFYLSNVESELNYFKGFVLMRKIITSQFAIKKLLVGTFQLIVYRNYAIN